MYYYNLNNSVLISEEKYDNLKEVSKSYALHYNGIIYALKKTDPKKTRRSYAVTDPGLLFLKDENIKNLLCKSLAECLVDKWIEEKINNRQLVSVNTLYPSWQDAILPHVDKKWKINIAGLGDVGGILLAGLKLLSSDIVSNIGIYDIDRNKTSRYEMEINQILPCFNNSDIEIKEINRDELFDCDMFVFCITKGVPDNINKDVRLAQYEGNARIIDEYAKLARVKKFKGIFAVLSDPVDLLCKAAFISSNTADDGKLDFKGIAPDNIRGFGLGVMYARALYYSRRDPSFKSFLKEGRIYGPHGTGLIIANSINNYNEDISIQLENLTKDANIRVRETGFKPYIAPALSSGSISIIQTITGEWNYSSSFMDGVFLGSRNKLTNAGLEIERLHLPCDLFERIKSTYERLLNYE